MAGNRYIISEGTPETQKPGTWWRALQGKVFMRCPECETTFPFGKGADGHAVNDQGDVHPSLDCPTPECKFHEYVILEGWTE